jgi:hypothetical protein
MKRWQLTTVVGLVILVAALAAPGLRQTEHAAADASAPCSEQRETENIARVYYPNRDVGNKIAISFKAALLETNYERGYHVVQVTPEEMALLAQAGLRIEADTTWEPPKVWPSSAVLDTIPGYSCYRSVEETFATAQGIVNDYPSLASWNDVGNSWAKSAGLGGYDMLVLVLTNSNVPGPKPKLFVTSAIHAREYTTAELMTRFAEYLVDNYGTDADATWLLDYHEVHLMLHANPDGRKKAETGLSWRKNTNQNYCSPTSNYRGADLNRNFSFQWACCGGSSSSECSETYHGPLAASEPETQAVQNYLLAQFPDQRGTDLGDAAPDDATGIYLDIHSYSELVLWPWGFTSSAPGNSAQLRTLGRKLAYWNGYSPGQAIGLYPTDGTTDDFSYGELGIASYTFELGTAFFQSCGVFENTIWPDNLPALIYAAKVARAPYLTPAGPDSYDLSLSSAPVTAGAQLTLNGVVNDARYNNSNGAEPTQNVAAAAYYVDTPPWEDGATAHAMSASDGSFDATSEGVQASVDTTGWSLGQHIIFVRGQDADGNWGAVSAMFLTIDADATPTPLPGVIFSDDFETDKGWTTDPSGTDTATRGPWERANPESTSYSGATYQLGTTHSGSYDLVTGGAAGISVGSYDIDGGLTSIRSPDIALPGGEQISLEFYYYLAHYTNSASDDLLRVKIVGSSTTTVLQERGAANADAAAWDYFEADISAYAGQTVYLLVEVADAGSGSLIEAALDDVLIE